jgi:Amt family ammonium transporter
LDTFGVHGVGGMTGALLTGVFATVLVNSGGADGLLAGNPRQVLNQLVAVLITIGLSAVGTLVLLKVVDLMVGLRVSVDDEVQGLDLTQHGEVGYNL